MIAASRVVRRARVATWSERVDVARALVYVAAVDMVLRLFGFRRLAPHLRPAAGSVGGATALPRASARAVAVARAARLYPAHAACLHRAAALQLWLRRSGLPSEFRIGVRKDGSELRAHAWVEVGGEPVTDSPVAIAPFTPIYDPAESRVSQLVTGSRTEAGLRWS